MSDMPAVNEPGAATWKPITDPRTVPVTGVDRGLPPVDPSRLTLPAIRHALSAAARFEPALAGDLGDRLPGVVANSGRAPAGELRPAAVLVPLVERGTDLHVLLTHRATHLRAHAGQISFPGGRAEPDDADAVATALREAREEIGLVAGDVTVLGCLPAYATITRFSVVPVVGAVPAERSLTLDPQEVAAAFEVPLAFLMNPAHHQRHAIEGSGGRSFLSMPWTGPDEDGVVREHFIWGATAAMLRNLYHVLIA